MFTGKYLFSQLMGLVSPISFQPLLIGIPAITRSENLVVGNNFYAWLSGSSPIEKESQII